MGRLSDRGHVTRLIQDTLGCGCPREVFEHYLVQLISAGHSPKVQLILGNRLLVWIIDGSKVDRLEKRVPSLLEEGRLERDSRNLNRFRLVLVGQVPESQAKALSTIKESADPKVHLHLLPHI